MAKNSVNKVTQNRYRQILHWTIFAEPGYFLARPDIVETAFPASESDSKLGCNYDPLVLN